MSIFCKECKNVIDYDSIFCKYCGKMVEPEFKSMTRDYGNIFNKIHETILKLKTMSSDDFNQLYDRFRYYEKRTLNDNDYYRILVDIIFYSGFKASTVDKYINRIHFHFSSIEKVSLYDEKQIDRICQDPLIIRNKMKIKACYNNALKMKEIISNYGSFQQFVDYYQPSKNEVKLSTFKKILQQNFQFLGGITVYHFLTDIGLNVIKPDRVIMRIFTRLDLVKSNKDFDKAIEIGRLMSLQTGYPIRFVDLILVLYGQLNHPGIVSICTDSNPKCNLCLLKKECQYYINNH